MKKPPHLLQREMRAFLSGFVPTDQGNVENLIEACDFVLAQEPTAENAGAQKAAAELKTELQREKP